MEQDAAGNLVQKKLAAGAPHDPPPLAINLKTAKALGITVRSQYKAAPTR
jgi:hypothetical protein